MKLCHWSDLPDGASRGFDPAGHGQDTVIVVRQGLRLHCLLYTSDAADE